MAPPLTEVADIQLQLTTHLSTPKAWMAESADVGHPLHLIDLLASLYRKQLAKIKVAGTPEQ